MEAISKQTGSATLSCEHTFHFRCIDSWFGKQIMEDLPQTCPCCRGQGTDMDRCEIFEIEDDEEDDVADDESESIHSEVPDDLDDEIRWERVGPGRWMVISCPEMALEGVRSLFGPLNELDFEEEPQQEADLAPIAAAQKIQAVVRGVLVRNTFQTARALVQLMN